MITAAVQKRIAALGLSEEQVYRALDPALLLTLSEVSPNPDNPKQCNDARLLQVASSLLQEGWVQSEMPLVWATPDGRPTRYQLINGEHRWMICKMAGFENFPALISPTIQTQADATALCMKLEEARARRDGKKYAENLLAMAAEGRDEELRAILRIKDPAALRAQRERFAAGLEAKVQRARTEDVRPRLVSLTMTREQHEAYTEALGKARTRLRQAQETVDMVRELSEGEIVAIAAVVRNGSSQNCPR